MVTQTQLLAATPPKGAALVSLIEALTALELTSEATRVHLDRSEPNLSELRKLNSLALRDVEVIVHLVTQIRTASGTFPTFRYGTTE